jgi:hypothetical protein
MGRRAFCGERGGYALGYTAEIAVSEDHLIVVRRVTLNPCDVPALVPLVKEVEERTGASPKKPWPMPDSTATRMCGSQKRVASTCICARPEPGAGTEHGQAGAYDWAQPVRSPRLKAMRKKLCSWAGRRVYERRKTLVEPVFGVLKQQRWMRLFRTRGPAKVATEFTLAALAYNLTRGPQAGTGKPTNRGNWRDRKAEQGACQRQTSSHVHTASAAPPKAGFFSDLFSRGGTCQLDS